MKKIKGQTPRLTIFDEMNPHDKDSVYHAGLREYKTQIETTKNNYFGSFDSKLNKNSFMDQFRNLLPLDRLNNLTELSKKRLSENAVNFIGTPGEGHARLY